jgi:hypothetical protein
MSMNDELFPKQSEKKPYEKPKLFQVALRPEEAVLGNCKISGTSGPASAACTDLTCSTIGS